MLAIEDSSRLTGMGLGAVMIALGAALVPMAYVGFLGLPIGVLGVVLLCFSALALKDGHVEPAPAWAGAFLIVLGGMLLALAAWQAVVSWPARPQDAAAPSGFRLLRELLHLLVSPALVVAGMRLRLAWSALGCAGLYGLLLAALPVALLISAIFVRLWALAA